jgi:hypothetical protein
VTSIISLACACFREREIHSHLRKRRPLELGAMLDVRRGFLVGRMWVPNPIGAAHGMRADVTGAMANGQAGLQRQDDRHERIST